MQKTEKERVVAELTEQLRSSDSLIVADYRGLTNSELEELRASCGRTGRGFTVVKNTLTRRAAEAAGADALLDAAGGADGDRLRRGRGRPGGGGQGALRHRAPDEDHDAPRRRAAGRGDDGRQVETLAKLPPLDVLRGQLVGVIIAPLTQLLGLLTAPLRDLVGVIDARIDAAGGAGRHRGAAAAVVTEPAAELRRSRGAAGRRRGCRGAGRRGTAVADGEPRRPSPSRRRRRATADETENDETENNEEE